MENSKDNLMIGEGVSITGSISLSGILYVYGNVNGEVVANEINVGASGTVNGDVKVDKADVSGVINNAIHAKDALVIRSTGKVSGNISYQTIEIESGGIIDGKIDKATTGQVLNLQKASSSD